MKNASKLEAIRSIAGIIVTAIIALAIIGCKEDEPTPQPQPLPQPTVPSVLHGTWTSNDGYTYEFTANSYTYSYPGNRHWVTGNILSYSNEVNTNASTKADYPSGYKLVCKTTSASSSFESYIGKEVFDTLFLNTAQNKMIPEGETAYVYEKK